MALMAQWQSTGGSSQRCPWFNSQWLPVFSLSSVFDLNSLMIIVAMAIWFTVLHESRYKLHTVPLEWFCLGIITDHLSC